jgi:HemY protein
MEAMRSVIWLVLLFTVAVVAATSFGRNDGLVSVYWSGWRFDVSLNVFLLTVLLTCAVLVVVFNSVNTLLGLPARAREWRLLRRERAAQAALRDALAETYGGRYSRAHKSALRALAIQDDTPELGDDRDSRVLAHLLAAGSLHRLQDRMRRDEQLRRALRLINHNGAARSADEGARLLAAEWALDDRDAQRALELLSELPPGVARRSQALRLKLQAARLADQPHEALRTARLLAKHQAFSKSAAQGLLRSLAIDVLNGARDADQLRRAWQLFDPADRRDPHVAAHAAARAAALGASDYARSWLRPFWDRIDSLGPDERAAVSHALVSAAEGITIDWLPRLESAAQDHPNEPAVAYAVGAVFAERQLWGKARRLLEQAAQDDDLPASARRHAWQLLARLADDESDPERAALCHAEAAQIA